MKKKVTNTNSERSAAGAALGRKGGKAVARKFGKGYMKKLGKKGAKARWNNNNANGISKTKAN